MLEKFRCKLSDYENAEEAKRNLLKKIKKEWEMKETFTQTENFSYENIYEFEEGRDICFFIKDDIDLYYCGPFNMRRRKLSAYTLWTYDYCLYINNKQIVINDLSYIWDTVYSLRMPEQLICNPMISVEKEEGVSIVQARKIYDSSEIKNIYLIDALPSSDNIYRTYTITLYVNGIMNNRVNNIRNFEPSINFPNRIYYQSLSGNEYVSCGYTKGWEYEICEYPESYHRKKAWNNFWLLMYWSGEDGKLQNYKMNKKQKQLFEKRVQVYNSGFFDYYFSTTNNIADAVIDNFFSKRTEAIKYPAMFEEDFSHKYRIRIAEDDQELLSLWIYFCMEQMVVEPCVCGIYVGTLINGFRNENPINEEINEIVRLTKKHLTNNYTKIVHSLMEIYPYETLLSGNGNSFKYENDIIKKMYSYVCANRKLLQEKYSARKSCKILR